MNTWFSNRGQIVQVVAAALAVSVALFVAAKQDFIRIDLALALGAITVLIIYILFSKHDVGRSAIPVSRESAPLAPALTSAPVSVPSSASAATESLSALFRDRPVLWGSENVRLRKGERWIDKDKNNAIRLLEVIPGPEGPKVEISARAELNNFCVGSRVERRASSFVLPESSFHDQNCIIVSYTVSKIVICLSVRVEHINEHSAEAEFVITKVSNA